MKHLSLLAACLLLVIFNASAQLPTYQTHYTGQIMNQYAPPPPGMANFQVYGDIPVNYSTGIPNISIPLGAVKLKGFEWPISISYHAGGNKVEEFANPAGLGWVLNAGGFISEKVMGQRDLGNVPNEIKRIYNLSKITFPFDGDCFDLENIFYEPDDVALADGHIANNDLYQPDMYYINSPLLTNKFMTRDTIGYTMPRTDLHIRYVSDSIFRVRDNMGNTYYFNPAGTNWSTYDDMLNSVSTLSSNVSFSLTKIVTYSGDEINFTYYTDTYYIPGLNTETRKRLAPGECNRCDDELYLGTNTATNSNTVTERRIKEISSKGQKVEFIYSSRTDNTGSKKLDEVKFYNTITGSDVLLYSWAFSNSYFGSSGSSNLRLKLESITQKDASAASGQVYSFSYNSTDLPTRLSKSIDYGGFYNGSGNSTLIPSLSNREPNLTYAQASILTRVTYPTGGYTDYTYQLNHEYWAGLSVKTIKDYDRDNTQLKSRTFEYPSGTMGLGHVDFEVEDYNYLFFHDTGNCSMNHDLGNSELQLKICNIISEQSSPVMEFITQFSDMSPSYATVTEYFGDSGGAGKIVYTYDPLSVANYSRNNAIDHTKHLLTEQATYKKNGGSYDMVASKKFFYELPATSRSHFDSETHPWEASFWMKTLRLRHPDLSFTLDDGFTTRCFSRDFLENDYRIDIYPVYLRKTEDREYRDGLTVLAVKQFDYDDLTVLQPSRSYYTNSDGVTNNEYTQYSASNNSALSLSTDENNAIAYYLTRNRINEPVYRKLVKNSVITFSERLYYKLFGGKAWLEKDVIAPAGGSDLNQVEVHAYDSYGNPLSVSQAGGPKTVMIWSYKHQHLVAEIKNADLSSVVTALGGQTAVDTFSASASPNVSSFFSGLRAALPGALISTFSYAPQVGLVTSTDPKGMSLSYEYDNFLRLKQVKDQDGYVVKTYQYNYKQ